MKELLQSAEKLAVVLVVAVVEAAALDALPWLAAAVAIIKRVPAWTRSKSVAGAAVELEHFEAVEAVEAPEIVVWQA